VVGYELLRWVTVLEAVCVFFPKWEGGEIFLYSIGLVQKIKQNAAYTLAWGYKRRKGARAAFCLCLGAPFR
jgi:hypothetical protein